MPSSIWPTMAAISSRCRSFTAPPIRCSRISCRGRASPAASPKAIRPDAIARLIDQDTKAIYCESIGNPAGNICDIEALANVAHAHGVPLVVDNTVATPILVRPIDYGADIVVHSLTKFMGGHGTTLGGAIVDSGKFPWGQYPDRFPMFSKPDASYHGMIYTEHFGPSAYIERCRSVYQRTTGSVLPAMSAFLLLQGIETVALRVERHVDNARKVAEFLRGRRACRLGELRRFSRQSLSCAGAEIFRRPRVHRC